MADGTDSSASNTGSCTASKELAAKFAAYESDGDGSYYVPSDFEEAGKVPSEASTDTELVESEGNEFLINLSDDEEAYVPDVEVKEAGFEGDEELGNEARTHIQREVAARAPIDGLKLLMECAAANAVILPQCRKEVKVGWAPHRGDSRWQLWHNAKKEAQRAASMHDCRRIDAIFKPLPKSEPESGSEPEPEVLDLVSEPEADITHENILELAVQLVNAPLPELDEFDLEVSSQK